MTTQSFNFSSVLQSLYSDLTAGKINSDSGTAKLLPYLMPIPTVRQYLAHYFGQNFYLQMYQILTDENLRPPTEYYMHPRYYSERASEKSEPRMFREYFLTGEQKQAAIKIYQDAPMLRMVVAAIQSAFVDYFLDLNSYNTEHFQEHVGNNRGPFKDGIPFNDALMNAWDLAENFSMMHDLMPAIALSMSKKGWVPGDSLREEIFSHGLSEAFAMSCFRTTTKLEDGNLVEVRCPFTKIIAHAFNTVLERDGQGGVRVAEEQSTLGALPLFVEERIVELHTFMQPGINPYSLQIS